jgi:hypothetical protein
MHNKMPLRFGVALTKPNQILVIEGRFVQELKDTLAREPPAKPFP